MELMYGPLMPELNAPLLQVANEPWYSDPADARCPHDAWLRCLNLTIDGNSSDAAECKKTVQIDLLNAYQTGTIGYIYKGVVAYTIVLRDEKKPGKIHRRTDWLEDTVEQVSEKLVRHRIRWEFEDWVLDAHEITYRWMPGTVG
jgi:hypothetical protein